LDLRMMCCRTQPTTTPKACLMRFQFLTLLNHELVAGVRSMANFQVQQIHPQAAASELVALPLRSAAPTRSQRWKQLPQVTLSLATIHFALLLPSRQATRHSRSAVGPAD